MQRNLMNRACGLALAAMLPVATAHAAGDLQITEIYTGISGEDGTADWFELTNLGDMAIDTGDFWYDDQSADINDGGQLDSIVLNPNESAIFLISDNDPQEIVDFVNVWGLVTNIGFTNGGGGLGQGGDTVNILDGLNTVVEAQFVDFDGLGGFLETVEVLNDTSALSVLGQNGAYESNPFFNDNIGQDPDFMVTLVGSPGLIPEPTSLALVAMGLIATIGRRRRA